MKKTQYAGAVLLAILAGFALLQPIVHPIDYAAQDLANTLASISHIHPFGTDHYGRDMLARIASAIRLSLLLALLSVLVSMMAGMITGVLAGTNRYFDRFFGFLCHLVMAIPGLIFILMFAAIAPGSFWALYAGICLVMWVEFFRVIRAITQTIAHSSEIQSSILLGMGVWYRFYRHYLPKLTPVVLTQCAFGAGSAILTLALLGFTNVGLRPPVAELGVMMTELFPYYYEAPHIFLQPIITVFLLMLSLQLLSGQVQ